MDAKRSNVASVGFSLFNMSSQFVTVVGVLCSTALSMRFGKKAVAIVGFSLTTVFMASFVLLPPDAIGTTFLMEYIRALTYAPTIPLIWAMFADVADYSEWKTGRRTTGVIFATILFGLKTGPEPRRLRWPAGCSPATATSPTPCRRRKRCRASA